MPEFLSDAWIAALDAAAATAAPPPGIAPFVLEQVVTGVTDRGDVRYHLVFTDTGVRACPGPAEQADVSFTTEYATAVELARGETNAQQALAAGRFRIGGDVDALVRRAGSLATLDDAFAAIRATTTYR
ncbi:MAG: SCP2 sterol-binding domain-containing protein [Acidimicrobiia bacterium]